jgi:hypothetical protein
MECWSIGATEHEKQARENEVETVRGDALHFALRISHFSCCPSHRRSTFAEGHDNPTGHAADSERDAQSAHRAQDKV